MDNFYLNVVSEGRPAFDAALGLCFQRHTKASHYALIDGALVLFWVTPPEKVYVRRKDDGVMYMKNEYRPVEEEVLTTLSTLLGYQKRELRIVRQWIEEQKVEAHRLMYPMDARAASDLVWNWLQQADYGTQPDHDGSNGKGWHIFTGAWGHVFDAYQGIAAICPTWAMYGK